MKKRNARERSKKKSAFVKKKNVLSALELKKKPVNVLRLSASRELDSKKQSARDWQMRKWNARESSKSKELELKQ